MPGRYVVWNAFDGFPFLPLPLALFPGPLPVELQAPLEAPGVVGMKKRRAQICLQLQRFIKFLQNYAGGRVRQPRTPNTSAARVVAKLIKLNSGSLSCQKGCFTLDSHMPTSDSFFSLQTQHDQSGKHKHNKQSNDKQTERKTRDMCSLC